MLFWPLITATGVLLLCRRLYYELTLGAERRRFMKQYGCKPITKIQGWDPIFGLDIVISVVRSYANNTVLQKTARMLKEYRNTIRLSFSGLPIIMTIEPENIKYMLALSFNDWELGKPRRERLGKLAGKAIFTTDGKDWEHSRALLRPNFIRKQYQDLIALEVHVQHLVDLIPKNGETVDLQEMFLRFTIDSATELLFGKSCESLLPDSSTPVNFANAFDSALLELRNQEKWGPLGRYFISDKPFQRHMKNTDEFIYGYIHAAIARQRQSKLFDKTAGERYVFLDELAKESQNPKVLRDEIISVLIAARDTTATLMSNLWFTLARQPEVWAKLHAEISLLCGEIPTHEQLKDMKYLRWCLSETLRLWPPVNFNGRMAVRDTWLPLGGGADRKSPIFVPKGQEVFWSTYALQRRKDIYGPDAEEFRPERWESIRPHWEYIPFSGGPRICIGQQFALTEAAYVTVRLVQNFPIIEHRDPKPWTEHITVVTSSKYGTQVGLRRG
ncbi:cytochrome P450 alkane hydroxylase, putative [Talaromyces stipitatus ATCC 10500]|uniref:Cytochrome P450 alkane hydroxylase, putative n=1 Tax=Talaromyces stipitatus (strain ATCC 10500 / CBS 375.48 / QM 6759 / NRRL 1006) TaxID=441959 RepID=B8M882_TALSN|nr:cytochrome P450 alkane hydroxylase, putative [Talaromyces stipitatus ATCC 10500]EED20395.1 cytochrome P450 alkane hydroxylase, putative [Talaromyces stipitatus ATCC 10500]